MNFTAIVARMDRLASANIHHLMDRAEEPERMLGQLVREMDEQITAACRALAHQNAGKKLLERQRRSHLDAARDAQEAVSLAMEQGDEEKARELLELRMFEEDAAQTAAEPLRTAEKAVQRLQKQLQRLRQRRTEVEHRRVELTLRQRAAQASVMASGALGKGLDTLGVDSCLSRMEVKVTELEAEAEVCNVPGEEDDRREQARRLQRHARVEREFALLRERVAASDSTESGND